MLKDILSLKERVFNGKVDAEKTSQDIYLSENNQKKTDNISLDEILEYLTSKNPENSAFIFSDKDNSEQKLTLEQLGNHAFLVEEKKINDKKLFLYEFFPNTYYIYFRIKKDDEQDKSMKIKVEEQQNNYGLFAPTGVIVRRVPQNILGNGILGRAFIYSNYIEILDSLIGNEYFEVLTHEVLHIMYPERKETEIRQMTRNYLGNTIYH